MEQTGDECPPLIGSCEFKLLCAIFLVFVMALDVESAGVARLAILFGCRGDPMNRCIEGNVHGGVLNSRVWSALWTRYGHSRRHLGEGSDDPSGSGHRRVAFLTSLSVEHGGSLRVGCQK